MGNLFTVPAITVGPVNQPSPTPTTPTPPPQIQIVPCPSDFVSDGNQCRVACANGFTYSATNMLCRSNTESTVTYMPGRARAGNDSEINTARSISSTAASRANVQVENLRLTRANQEGRRSEVTGASAAAGSLTAGAALMNGQQQQFNRSARLVRDTTNSLRIRRPPVQPETEIPKEQRRIQEIVQKNAMFIQIVLVLVFACAVSYLVLPMETANYVSLAILSVALIYRFFLMK
jgi:hypothetical protein